jgi:hypothetical protein
LAPLEARDPANTDAASTASAVDGVGGGAVVAAGAATVVTTVGATVVDGGPVASAEGAPSELEQLAANPAISIKGRIRSADTPLRLGAKPSSVVALITIAIGIVALVTITPVTIAIAVVVPMVRVLALVTLFVLIVVVVLLMPVTVGQ